MTTKSPARDGAEFAIWRRPMKQLKSYDLSAKSAVTVLQRSRKSARRVDQKETPRQGGWARGRSDWSSA